MSYRVSKDIFEILVGKDVKIKSVIFSTVELLEKILKIPLNEWAENNQELNLRMVQHLVDAFV